MIMGSGKHERRSGFRELDKIRREIGGYYI